MVLRTQRMILRTGNKQRIAFSVKCTADKKKLFAIRYPLNTRGGLTLIEVLLAVSILGFGLVGVLRGYASSIATLAAGQHNIDAVNLLKKKMAEVEIMVIEKEKISQESEDGLFEDPFQDIIWEWDIKPADKEDLYALSVTVSSEYNPREFSLKTYVADKKVEEEEE